MTSAKRDPLSIEPGRRVDAEQTFLSQHSTLKRVGRELPLGGVRALDDPGLRRPREAISATERPPNRRSFSGSG